MSEFGGFGGYAEGKDLDSDDEFEIAVNKVLGDRIRASDQTARQMWGALAINLAASHQPKTWL